MTPRSAFTLIELILVTVIILVLIGLAVPIFRNTFSDLNIKNASFNISKLINYAQEKAILERKEFKMALDFEKGVYQLFEKDYSLTAPEKKIAGRFGKSFKLPRDAFFVSPRKFIRFYPDGRCDEVNIDVFDKTGAGYKITAKGFGSLVEVREIEDARI